MNPTRHLQQVRDLRIERTVPVITPAQLLEELPLTDDQAEVVLRGRDEIGAVLDRADDRLLVVVGPCSVHDVEAARDYAERLAARAAELSDDLCIAMRVYFEKPRTTTGWKGMITDPHLDGSGDVNAGGRMGRDRSPDRREPDAPPARVGAVDAGWVQEPHRRKRAGRGRRGAGGGGS